MDYIKEAKKYYKIALRELEEASKNGKIELAIDGCGKGWKAVILATYSLFEKSGEKRLPRTYRGRYFLLAKYGTKELNKIFYSARNILHIDGFYDGLIDYKVIFECMENVKDYIEEIERRC